MNQTPTLSIVAPVYNEEGNVANFYERVRDALETLDATWEIIFVNDGSRDKSLPLMQELHAQDERIKIVNFARNFGHQVAVTAGIDFARGDAVVLIDTDLQDPPEVIPDLVAKWREGFDVVYAVREERKGESWFKLFTAKLFYRIIYRITEVDIPLDTGDFRLMDRRVADVLRHMREHNRFIRGMTSWIGFKQTGVGYVRDERHWGETKYPLKKMLQFAMDAVTSFSFFPLQVMIYLSAFLSSMALLVAVVISVLRLTLGEEFFGGQATTIVLLLFLTSFQLFFQFIIGQYVARTYDESRARPLYIVADVTGMATTPAQHLAMPQPYIVAETSGFEHEQEQRQERGDVSGQGDQDDQR
jgi:glycosyltransferase involved in cell wall biosynthesis